MKYQCLAVCGMALLFAGAAAFAQAPQEAPAALAGDPDAGAELYGASCNACHANGIGPSMRGLIGRPIAGVADFPGYTDALRAKAGESWTEASLDAFLADAQAYAPGTAMTVIMPDPRQRADVIAYIASLPPPRQ